MALNRTCDGINRRDFLQAGALGAGAISLRSFLAAAEAGNIASHAPARAGIFINLNGGPSHIDTFDPKPNAPAEIRGEFDTISTAVPGISVSEHLPRLAATMDKFVIVRNVSHTLASHPLGTEYVNSGNRPIPSLEFPGYGAVITRELGGASGLPPQVSIPNSVQKPGYLGVQYAPFHTNSTPQAGAPYSVRGISLANGVTIHDLERRQNLLADLDRAFAGFEKENQLLQGLDRFSQQAFDMLTSDKARRAFDVSQENPSFAQPFGQTSFGQSCLLAARLVEAGVRFVTISNGGWDTHQNNFSLLKDKLLPPFDEGLAALLAGLAQKGLLESTIVYVTGEFGRTPKVKAKDKGAGRDHYPRCMSMLFAGGGIAGGRVVGASTDDASEPAGNAYTPDDAATTLYRAFGIDHTKEYHTSIGRPVMIVRDGRVIEELFSSRS